MSRRVDDILRAFEPGREGDTLPPVMPMSAVNVSDAVAIVPPG